MSKKNPITFIAAALVIAVCAAAAFLLTRPDAQPDAAETPSTTAPKPVAAPSLGAPGADAATDVEVTTAPSPTGTVPGVVRWELTLSDPATDGPAVGLLRLDLNATNGDICFSASGIDGSLETHIHQQANDGAPDPDDELIVDLGELENGARECVTNSVSATAAMIADPGGHYVDMHDGGELVLRSELANAAAAS